MTESKIQAILIQQRRRRLLSILLEVFPHPLDGDVILGALLEIYPATEAVDVHKDLAYLADPGKGYVRLIGALAGISWKKRVYQLTASGNEVANRIVDDPALGYMR